MSGAETDALGPDDAERDEAETAEAEEATPRIRFGIVDLVVAVVVGFFFAVSVWGAIGNLVGLPPYLSKYGHADATPWLTLIGSVVVPVLIFVAALVLGRGRASFPRTLILVAALAANSALALTLYFLSLNALPYNL